MEELGPLFVHPHESYSFWILPAALGALGVLVAAVGVMRGRLSTATGISGLILIPCFAYLLGNLTLIERAKEVEFCGSCHETMGPLVASLQDENGSLASIHYRKGAVSYLSGCYTCHSGYGVWGSAGAKLAGMRHMWHTVTGNYEYPLALNGHFDVSACLDCHAESQPFRAVDAHRDLQLQQALLSGELGCAGLCHPPAHPEEALNGWVQR